MFRLDHLAIAATSLDDGVETVESALGIRLSGGGEHPLMATHNRLLGLGDTYLEVIAINPAAPAPAHPRWFDLDHFSGRPRLSNWIIACTSLEAGLAALPGSGHALDLARGDLRWRMAVPPDGRLPFGGAQPALIQWQGSTHPTQRLPDTGIRLTRLEIATPHHAALTTALSGLFQDPRVIITPGETLDMRASFATPNGPRLLQ